MFQPIIYKEVEDIEGKSFWVELWQGDQHIKVSLAHVDTLSEHMGEAKWDKIKLVVDKIADERHERVQKVSPITGTNPNKQ